MENREMIFEKIWIKQKELIGDMGFVNSKLMIMIAGVPGSGKTTLLKEVQKQLNSLYIRSDDVRDILNYEYHDNVLANNPELKDEYFEYITEKYLRTFKNGTVIWDKSLDRTGEFLLSLTDKYNYKRFIISLNCSEEILKERISNREKEYKEVFLQNLPKWIDDHEKFNQMNNVDISLDTGTMNLKEIVKKILISLNY